MAFIRQNQVVANVFPNEANKLFLTVKRLKKEVVVLGSNLDHDPEFVEAYLNEGESTELY